MRKQLLIAAIVMIAILPSAITASADYSNAVVSLNPVAYWPLNETAQPPPAYVATNSGTLGAAGNGYYETWFNPTNNGYIEQMDWTGPVPGATSDGDGAASFTGNGNRYIQIPHTYPGTVIQAPFTVECWTYPTNANDWENIVGAGGQGGRVADAKGDWAGFSLGLYNGSWLFDLYNTNGDNNSIELNTTVLPNQWNYLVATFDGTNAIFYLNGNVVATGTPGTNSAGLGYVPDSVNPILLGRLNPSKYDNAYSGLIDEVAIYTNVLSPSDITSHYNDATAGGYAAAVLADAPVIYLRLDEPLYVLPPSNTFSSFPPANNYGSLGSAAAGFYQPGTLQGLPGPAGGGFGTANYAVAINGMDAAVDVGNGNLTNVAPSLNVTGTNSLSVIAWFKGNPADGYNRFQGILGHSDSGWRFGLGSSGPQFNPGSSGDLSSSSGDSYNDGRWHMVVGVYDSISNYLYLDGSLIASTAYSGSQAGSARDVILGGAPDYTTPSGRYWDGSLAQVAFFTNALSAANILQLYTAAEIFPYITQQPVPAVLNAGVAYTNSVAVAGSPAFSYQWYQNGSPVPGQTNAALVYNPVQGTNAGNYFVIVSNNGGAVTSSVVALTVYTSPQIINQPGTNYVLFTGGSATFSLAASGAVPLYYYWSSNNVTVAVTASPDYTLTGANASAGYSCLVSNFVGTVQSGTVSVSVIAQPTNTYPQAVLAGNPVAFWRLDEADEGYPNDGVTAHDYWGGYNGTYNNTELGQTGYPAIPPDPDTAALFGDIANSGSDVLIPGIGFATPNGGNAEFSVEAWVNAPSGQINGAGIIAKGTGGGGEQFNLDTGAGSAPNYAFRFFVRDAGGNAHLANSTNTPDGQWHHLVGVCDEANGQVSLYVDGLLAANGTITPGSGLLSSAIPVSIGSRQSGSSGVYDAQLYGTVCQVAVYNYALSPAQVAAEYYSAGVAAVILQQPTNTVVNEGDNAIFSVVAGGTPELAYQWLENNSPILGATNSTLGLTNVPASDNGYYYSVIVSNADGTATSGSALLTVLQGPPVLTTDISPLYVDAFAGLTQSYTVGVSGTAPLYYQWLLNSEPIPLATNSTYSFTILAGTNTYSCTVTNAGGSISSSTATVVGIDSTNSLTSFAINFHDYANYAANNNGNYTEYVLYVGQGAYNDPGNNVWNGFGDAYTSGISALASSGATTPVSFSLNYGEDNGAIYNYDDNAGNNSLQGTPGFLLGQDALVNNGNTGTFTFTNVPTGNYDLYVYAANYDDTRGAVITVGGDTQTVNNNLAVAGTDPATNFVNGLTYVVFHDVLPTTNGVVTGTWNGNFTNPNSGLSGEGDVNGFQLVKVSVSQSPTLTISRSGGNVVISWIPSVGQLQAAGDLTGTFTNVTGITSPYTNSPSGQLFYRVKVQ